MQRVMNGGKPQSAKEYESAIAAIIAPYLSKVWDEATARKVVTEWIEHELDESLDSDEIAFTIEQREDLIQRLAESARDAALPETGGRPSENDARMELDLILIQWTMPDDLRAALKHLKHTLERSALPNPSMAFPSRSKGEQ